MALSLIEYINKNPRPGVLSTADAQGRVDAFVFGSPIMTDDRTMILGLAKNRTLTNLQGNPNAVFLTITTGETLAEWKGVRIYLRVLNIADSGPVFDDLKKQIARMKGDAAAGLLDAAVRFEVTGVLPLIDIGRTWEQSV